MRKVLAVIPAPTFGGAANQVLQLHRPLRERGWDIVTTVPDEPGNTSERLRDGGVRVIEVPAHRTRATRDLRVHAARLAHLPREIGQLRRIIRDEQASLVINHGDLNPDAGIAGHLEGIAVHWQILDSRTPMAARQVTMRLVTRLADSIAAIGYELARTHPGALAFDERCVIIYTAVVPERFERARERRAVARAELGVREDAFLVASIGNRNPQKGHEWLVRGGGEARRRRPDVAVRVLGAPSPGHEAYERGFRSAATALGLSESDGSFGVVDPGARVPELIGALDVLCMPSVPNSEGIPTVMLEAMAAGVPVVATDVGAVRETIVDDDSGLVVPPLDATALADAFVRLAEDRALGERLAASARRRRAERFGFDALVDRYDDAFTSAVVHRAGRKRRRRAGLTM